MLSLQGAQVQFLVGEPDPTCLMVQAKKKRKKEKEERRLGSVQQRLEDVSPGDFSFPEETSLFSLYFGYFVINELTMYTGVLFLGFLLYPTDPFVCFFNTNTILF